MGSPSVVRRSKPPCGMAAFAWNQWQPSCGINGRLPVESVATFVWNQWQLSRGISGRFGVEYANKLARGMKAGVRYPMRQIFAGCAVAVSGAVSRLRVSVTRHPTALYHMVLSSSRSYADHLLSIEAERWASAAAGSGSAADAVGSQLHALVGRSHGLARF